MDIKKDKNKRFWLPDHFIRKYAKDLSIHAQMVYVVLCCHVNSNDITFIGCRKIAENLGINKSTVSKKIKELEAYGYVVRLDKERGKPSHIRINSVPNKTYVPSHQVVPKEINTKEVYKEKTDNKNKEIPYKGRELMLEELKKINPKFYKKFYGN
jgi:biotin operon repressor